MSGETEQNVSGWTIDSLKEHVETLFVEKDLRDQQRFDAQQLALKDALIGQEKAVAAALTAAERAVLKAEAAAEKRFESVNEFRQTLSDQATNLMPRHEAEQRITTVTEKTEGLEKRFSEALAIVNSRLDLNSGRSGGLQTGWGYLVGAIGLAATVIAIVIAIRP